MLFARVTSFTPHQVELEEQRGRKWDLSLLNIAET